VIRLLGRVPRGIYVLLGLAAAVAIGFSVWRLQTGSAASADTVSTARATLGDIIVSVGGVGRIVQTENSQIVVPSTGGGTASGSSGSGAASGGTSVPSGAVFSGAPGRIERFLVAPGQNVVAGQMLAVLNDGGAAANAVDQARIESTTAALELQQKQVSDPLRGFPPTAAELIAAQSAISAARQRLARLLGPPRSADVSSARLDVKRAEADLETLLGGTPAARASAIRIAKQAVETAKRRLSRLLGPPDPADVSAAKAEVAKAEADLATLLRPNITPSPEALAAAQKAVNEARSNLAVAQKSGDTQAVKDAQAALDEALAELATLLKPGPGALPAQIDAAQAAVDAAKQKLQRLLGPPNPADVTAARLDVERAEADLRARETGPSPAALAAAKQAVAAARSKLAQLLGRPLRADVFAARLELSKAEADLALLQARGNPASSHDIEVARLKVESAQERLGAARAAEKRLSVRATSNGTVTALLTVPGAPVDTTTPIATVDNLKRLAVRVDLSEFDAARVKRGMRAVVSVDALGGRKYPGKVLFAALTGTDNGGVVTFPVQVSLDRTGGLKPGMTVSVRIIVAERHDVVRVPLEAVTRDEEDRPIVSVPDTADVPHPRLVRVGLSNNKLVEIKTNVSPGERVLLPDTQSDGGGEEP